MYCTKCGKEIADTDNVCKFCGVPVEKVSDESAVNNNESEVVEVNEPEITVPVDSNEPVVADVDDLTQEAPKPAKSRMSKKKKFTILGICATFVVAVALSVVLFWDYVENTAVSTFSSPEKYYHYVEEKNVEKTAESLAAALNSVNEFFIEDAGKSTKSEISIHLGDVLLDSLAKNLGTQKSEISWASDIDLSEISTLKNGVSSSKSTLSLNDKPIMNIELVFKSENMSYYLRIPELNKEYMFFRLVPYGETSDGDIKKTIRLFEALPDEETTTEIITRYLNVAIRSIDEAEKQKVSVTANGVEQSCTELTVKIDEEVIADIVEALLKEFKNDKEIKGIIKKFYQAVEPISDKKFDMEYEDLMADVDEFIEDIDEFEDDLGNVDFTVVTWVDSKGKTIGRELLSPKFDGQLRYLSTYNGTDVGIEYCAFSDYGEGIELIGEGDIKKGKMSGNLELFYVNIKQDKKDFIANISIKDYDVDLIEDDYVSGVFTISLSDDFSKDLVKDLGLPNSALKYLKNGEIEISIDTSEDKSSFEVKVLYDSEPVITISSNTTKNKVADITAPEKGFKINDSEDLIDYIGDMKFDTLKENLKAAGVPSDLVDAVFRMADGDNNQVQGPPPGDSFGDDLDVGGSLDYNDVIY